jgi:glycosyltransferase involved in cell wall biosynthesis
MTETSPESDGSPSVVRVLAARVEGERLLLLGEVVDGPADGAAPVPGQLVLRDRASGEELQVDLTADGADAPLSAAIDARALLTDRDVTTWEVRIGPGPDDASAWSLEPALDTAKVPSVIFPRGDDLLRVRLRMPRPGELVVRVDGMPPHAEVQHVLVEEDAVVLEAVLDRVTVPPGAGPLSLVASSRERKVEVEAPVELDDRTVRGRIPLGLLVSDLPQTEYWDLSVRSEALGTLRVGGHLDDVTDKKNTVVFPALDVPSPGGGRSLRPYFTVHNNLSVRSTPLNPTPSAPASGTRPAPEQGKQARSGLALRRHKAARWVAMAAAQAVVRWLPDRRAAPPVRDGRPRVSILIVHGYGMGGTVRTVFNQAASLIRDHDVEIVSQLRDRHEPFFDVPDGVNIRGLDDRTEGVRLGRFEAWVRERLSARPSLLVHEVDVTYPRCTQWTDVQMVRWFRAQRGGIIMATRPSLNLLLGRLAAPGVVTVGQEHMNFPQHNPLIAVDLHREYHRLDALTVLTNGDLEDYSRVLAGTRTRVVRIPNAVSPLTGGLSDPTSRMVVAAGRLTNQKGFDRLIPAFEQVVRVHPDWTLRIYGSGPHRNRLQRMILERGLYNSIRLMGRATSMGEELAKASIYVMSSRFEGFPMVLLEAMSKALAVVTFDCPRGPADLITPGEDGLLVPNGDIDGLAQGLLQLIEDEKLRRRMGAAAQQTAAKYDGEAIGRQWDQLLSEVLTELSPAWWRAHQA